MGCPFNSRKCVIFLVYLSSGCAHGLFNPFPYIKILLFYDDNVNQLR